MEVVLYSLSESFGTRKRESVDRVVVVVVVVVADFSNQLSGTSKSVRKEGTYLSINVEINRHLLTIMSPRSI